MKAVSIGFFKRCSTAFWCLAIVWVGPLTAAPVQTVNPRISYHPGPEPRAHVMTEVRVRLFDDQGVLITRTRCLCTLRIYDQPSVIGQGLRRIARFEDPKRTGDFIAAVRFPHAGRYVIGVDGAPVYPGAFSPFAIRIHTVVQN